MFSEFLIQRVSRIAHLVNTGSTETGSVLTTDLLTEVETKFLKPASIALRQRWVEAYQHA